jgi:hypothetical protein
VVSVDGLIYPHFHIAIKGGNKMSLFGRKNSIESLDKVIAHIESTDERYSGLVRHYNHQGVRDAVKQETGITLSDDEVERVVGAVWCDNGWEEEPITHLDDPKPTWWQRLTGNY